MGKIAKSTIDAVEDLKILDVIQKYKEIEIRRSGSSYIGCCPFHSERTPSFSVSPAKNVCKCFSCQKGGGPIKFVEEYEGLEYRDAVLKLAKDHNIPIAYEDDNRTEEDLADERKREAMKMILNEVQGFFVAQFKANVGEAARQYAYGRWPKEYCDQVGIGYAPRDSKVLLEYLKGKGLDIDLCIELGIIGCDKDSGNLYSLLRQRVTIPVRNRTKQVVSFSCRYIGDNPDIMKRSKYMNLADSLVFSKQEVLFGIDTAAMGARASEHFVVVEGAPDAMRLHSLGIKSAVATLGTAMTEKHLRLLRRTSNSICFIPDSDPPKEKLYGAGVAAVMRSGMMAMKQGFDVNVKEIPRSKDDDENGVKYDADSFITSKDIYFSMEQEPFVLWYTKKRLHGATTDQLKSELIAEVAELLNYIEDKNLREMYVDKLAKIVGKRKMWQESIKNASRQVSEESLSEDNSGLDPNIAASLRRCGLIVKNGCYHAVDKDNNMVCVSNFIFHPVLHIKNSQRSKRIYRLHNVRGEEDIVEFGTGDLVKLNDFNSKIYECGFYRWRGDFDTFGKIQEHLLEITPAASHIEIMGWNPKEEFYAFSNGIYHKGKFFKTDKLGVVSNGQRHFYLPAFSDLHADNELGYSFERLFRCAPQGMTPLHDFVGQIIKVYGTGGMISFAWTLAAIFRDIIFAKFKFFPVLNLFGRKGSGKTELARALSSMFYTLPSTPSSCSNTSIPVIGYNLSHARNSIIILDEYTNDLMPQRIDLLKGLWGGTARSKMEDGLPVTIPVQSGVILAGQYKPEDEAIFSRCIHLMYSQTSFNRDEKAEFNRLTEMVLRGNTHLLLRLLDLRNIFEQGFFQMFATALNDVLTRLDKERIEDRILKDWVVTLAAFRVLEPHIEVPFTYNDLFETVVAGVRYQNEQIRKSSDTANFWLFLDSMHANGKVKEKCHFVIKRLSSFTAAKRDKREFIEPKRIIFLNFKAVRELLAQRYSRQKTGSTLDTATLESYLKSLPQYLGVKMQRFQILRNNGELEEEYKSEGGKSKKYVVSNPSNALCFDYDSLKEILDLNLETFRMTEDEMNAGEGTDEPCQQSESDNQEDTLPF